MVKSAAFLLALIGSSCSQTKGLLHKQGSRSSNERNTREEGVEMLYLVNKDAQKPQCTRQAAIRPLYQEQKQVRYRTVR